MEILKKILISASLFILLSGTGIAQDFVKKKDAFQKSYIQEATGEYIGAIKP